MVQQVSYINCIVTEVDAGACSFQLCQQFKECSLNVNCLRASFTSRFFLKTFLSPTQNEANGNKKKKSHCSLVGYDLTTLWPKQMNGI